MKRQQSILALFTCITTLSLFGHDPLTRVGAEPWGIPATPPPASILPDQVLDDVDNPQLEQFIRHTLNTLARLAAQVNTNTTLVNIENSPATATHDSIESQVITVKGFALLKQITAELNQPDGRGHAELFFNFYRGWFGLDWPAPEHIASYNQYLNTPGLEISPTLKNNILAFNALIFNHLSVHMERDLASPDYGTIKRPSPNTGAIVGITVACSVVALAATLAGYWWLRKGGKQSRQTEAWGRLISHAQAQDTGPASGAEKVEFHLNKLREYKKLINPVRKVEHWWQSLMKHRQLAKQHTSALSVVLEIDSQDEVSDVDAVAPSTPPALATEERPLATTEVVLAPAALPPGESAAAPRPGLLPHDAVNPSPHTPTAHNVALPPTPAVTHLLPQMSPSTNPPAAIPETVRVVVDSPPPSVDGDTAAIPPAVSASPPASPYRPAGSPLSTSSSTRRTPTHDEFTDGVRRHRRNRGRQLTRNSNKPRLPDHSPIGERAPT